jgi:dihydroxyacetone kinase-like protein
MDIAAAKLSDMFAVIAEAMTREKDRLCELDGVIGDADHGIAMELGFGAAAKAVRALDLADVAPTVVFNTAAKSFLNAVGASSGPLYATAFMRAGAAVKGRNTLDDGGMAQAFIAMARGIQERGKAEIGEKTMIDAWLPAANACEAALSAGGSLAECLAAAVVEARSGAEATKSMLASKGRASRLGDRVLGHVDPGAASAVVVIEAMKQALTGGKV